nr:retrovirus-related Pol polyprotein from transposon TNT 1-94 [Tanacetum cinerariifolium]
MTPRSCFRWKPTGKIFKTVGLRWVPTGKIFTSSTTKVDSEPTNGSDEDITNQYEYEQTLDVSACTLNLSAVTTAGTSVQTAKRSYYCQYKEVTTAQVKAEEGPNYALMSYTSSSSDSKVSTDSTCSKTCFETVNLLKSQNEQLLKDLKKSKLMVLAYKTRLKSVEERFVFLKKNKFIYLEDIKVLKVKIQMKKISIKELRRKLEVAQKEKDGIQLTVEKLENASKSLNKLIYCQIVDKCKKGLVDTQGYVDVKGVIDIRGNPKGGKIIGKGKFNGKADEGFFVGYSLNSKAFRVFNSRKRIVEENLHIRFSENIPNVDDEFKPSSDDGKNADDDPSKGSEFNDQEKENNVNSTNNVNILSLTVNTASTNGVNAVGELLFDPDMPALEDINTFNF